MAQPEAPSGTSTPRSFANQTASTEDLLKSHTVGLVHLDDFRKRRAEVLEQKEKEAQDKSYGRLTAGASRVGTPAGLDESDGALTPGSESRAQPPRKKKKKAPKGLLSFGDDEDEIPSGTSSPAVNSPRSRTIRSPDISCQRDEEGSHPRRLTPNPNTLLPAPKVQTKATLQAEAAARDNLRREFLALQEAVRNTEILMPFVFYDGTNIPGGVVQVKKGDHIWLFLERCRKVGAQLGVSGRGRAGSGGGNGGKGSAKSKSENRKEWARVGVDDLMCVRGEVIVPHHYEFYYFIANRVPISSKSSSLLFDYSNAVAQPKSDSADSNLRTPAHNEDLEGKQTDPTLTKVVDRRWYERNKHIFPASMWKEFEAGEGFQEKLAQSRRDAKGNAFFFS